MSHNQPHVVVIGGGFAGTAAAITLARANRTVALIDAGQPRNRFSEHAHGIIGMDDIPPMELRERVSLSLSLSAAHSCKRQQTHSLVSTTDGSPHCPPEKNSAPATLLSLQA